MGALMATSAAPSQEVDMKMRSSVRIEPIRREDLERRVVEIIASNLCIETVNMHLCSPYKGLLGLSYKELGADSLDLYAIMMDLEEELGVSIPDRVAQRFVTVADTVEFVVAGVCRPADKAGDWRRKQARRPC
jgi:acyl carrier protein